MTGYVGKTPLDALCVAAVGSAVMGMEFVVLALDVDAVFTEPEGLVNRYITLITKDDRTTKR